VWIKIRHMIRVRYTNPLIIIITKKKKEKKGTKLKTIGINKIDLPLSLYIYCGNRSHQAYHANSKLRCWNFATSDVQPTPSS